MMSLESAAFTFLVPAGCASDPEGLAGLGSFTCEMTLRGSGSRDSRQFIQDLENLGVERGESVSTSHTSFSGATLAKNLFPALEIFADLIRRPHFPEDQLEAARLVAIQELRAIEDEPGQKVMLELRRRQYPEPWGRSSHGELPALESIGLEDIRDYFAQHYHPNGTILGVAGQIDWQRLKVQVGRMFADWAPRDEAEPATGRSLAKREHLHHESNQTQIAIGFESLPYRHQDYFQAWGAVGVLSGGMSSRLFTEVREKRGLCYTVYATMHTLRDRGSVLCYAGTSAERAQETLDVTLAELVRLAQGIKADELARLKARIKSSLIMQQESSSSRSGSIARDWYHLGQVRTLDEVGALVDALSRDSINAYLAAHPPGDFTIVTLGPNPLEVPVGIS
ncbi:MAG: insulinase family protein [Planctomycetia bacterium]|nr:insulinase family protein [Planctomycetia bacterium]